MPHLLSLQFKEVLKTKCFLLFIYLFYSRALLILPALSYFSVKRYSSTQRSAQLCICSVHTPSKLSCKASWQVRWAHVTLPKQRRGDELSNVRAADRGVFLESSEFTSTFTTINRFSLPSRLSLKLLWDTHFIMAHKCALFALTINKACLYK